MAWCLTTPRIKLENEIFCGKKTRLNNLLKTITSTYGPIYHSRSFNVLNYNNKAHYLQSVTISWADLWSINYV